MPIQEENEMEFEPVPIHNKVFYKFGFNKVSLLHQFDNH